MTSLWPMALVAACNQEESEKSYKNKSCIVFPVCRRNSTQTQIQLPHHPFVFLSLFPTGSRSLLGCGHVLTPVEAFRVKSNAALRFNKAHAQLHGRAQQVFGSLKSRFQCLRDIGPIQSPELVACTIKACCVLHNICKKFSVPLPLDFSTEPLHPPSEVVNILAEQPFDYMEDTKEEMIEMFFNIAEDGNE